MKVEQADGGGSGHRNSYHRWLKKQKHRLERRAAKDSLRKEEDPIPDHKYKGWET